VCGITSCGHRGETNRRREREREEGGREGGEGKRQCHKGALAAAVHIRETKEEAAAAAAAATATARKRIAVTP